jgi:uncharacterized membrane protein YjdF
MHSPASRHDLRNVLLFSAVYILAAGGYSFARGNGEFIFYIVVMLVLVVALIAVHRRVGLSRGLLWCLSLWGLMHMAGGLLPIPAVWHDEDVSSVLYNLWIIPDWLKYDQFVHAYGFGITTWLCWQAMSARTLNEAGRPLEATPGLMVLCAAAGMGFGAFNEVIEFIATLTLPETNVGGYENTGWDLVFNLIGSAAAAVLLYRIYRPRSAT